MKFGKFWVAIRAVISRVMWRMGWHDVYPGEVPQWVDFGHTLLIFHIFMQFYSVKRGKFGVT